MIVSEKIKVQKDERMAFFFVEGIINPSPVMLDFKGTISFLIVNSDKISKIRSNFYNSKNLLINSKYVRFLKFLYSQKQYKNLDLRSSKIQVTKECKFHITEGLTSA